MSATPVADWRRDFGLDGRNPPNLFTSKAELAPATPQAHLLRRAFDDLKVDGILCVDHSPLAYFKLVKRVTPEAVAELHRQFWNHGGASLLVLVTEDRVHVYSGMVPPTGGRGSGSVRPVEVENLARVADALKAFVVSVETGEYFGRHSLSFDPRGRIDRHLLENLMRTRKALTDASAPPIPEQMRDALLCRLVFTCYLFDRDVIGAEYLAAVGVTWADDLRNLLGHSQAAEARDGLYRLFDKLKLDFNGDLFGTDLAAEKRLVHDEHMQSAERRSSQGMTVGRGRTGHAVQALRLQAFIPIETISAIYERFLEQRANGAEGGVSTPRDSWRKWSWTLALDGMPGPLLGKRFLDPACGSGIFLVGLFNRHRRGVAASTNPTARNDRRARRS